MHNTFLETYPLFFFIHDIKLLYFSENDSDNNGIIKLK